MQVASQFTGECRPGCSSQQQDCALASPHTSQLQAKHCRARLVIATHYPAASSWLPTVLHWNVLGRRRWFLLPLHRSSSSCLVLAPVSERSVPPCMADSSTRTRICSSPASGRLARGLPGFRSIFSCGSSLAAASLLRNCLHGFWYSFHCCISPATDGWGRCCQPGYRFPALQPSFPDGPPMHQVYWCTWHGASKRRTAGGDLPLHAISVGSKSSTGVLPLRLGPAGDFSCTRSSKASNAHRSAGLPVKCAAAACVLRWQIVLVNIPRSSS